jgi:CBS domain-containing protein
MAVADHGPGALLDAVAHHMTTNPRVVTEDDAVTSAMETITLEHQRHLPVVNNGCLTGLISIGDVGKYRLDQIENERKALHDYITKA